MIREPRNKVTLSREEILAALTTGSGEGELLTKVASLREWLSDLAIEILSAFE